MEVLSAVSGKRGSSIVQEPSVVMPLTVHFIFLCVGYELIQSALE